MAVLTIVMGLVLLALTWWELQREETDTVWVLGWGPWFDVSRQSSPMWFWIIISAQAVSGVAMVIEGVRAL
jgi:hypothetical protein